MKIRVLALSVALLFSTGAFTQDTTPPPSPNGGSSMTATQPGDTNGGAMQNNTPNDLNNTRAAGYGRRHHHGNWGWIGLFGLFGLFGMGRRGNRNDVVATTTLPRQDAPLR